MSAVMDNFSPSTFLQMPCKVQGFPDMPDKSIHFSTERSFVRWPCPTPPNLFTRVARDVLRCGTSPSPATRHPCRNSTACSVTITSGPSNCCQMAGPLLLVEKPAHSQSGTLLRQPQESRQNWLPEPQHVMHWPSAQTLKFASVAAATATLQSGTFTIKLWSDNSKVIQMEPVALIYLLMVQSCGLAGLTTLWGHGTWERVDNYSSMTSPLKSSAWGTAQPVIG